MNESIKFRNMILYRSYDADGRLLDSGRLINATGAALKDRIARSMIHGGTNGTLGAIHLRLDGLTTLGTFDTYYMATAYGTLYNNATSVNSLNLSATYTATANVTLKTAVVTENVGMSPTNVVGDHAYFYSTSFNMACGSAGKLVIDWTINL